MRASATPDARPMPLASAAPPRMSHPLADAGGAAMLLILAVMFLAPAVAWVEWGRPLGATPGRAVELRMLLWSVVLALLLPVLQIGMHIRLHGGSAIRGNRDAYPRTNGVAGRIARAHANMAESLVPFAASVLAAHALGASNRWTVAASTLYVAARATHALAYVLGVTIVRSSAFYAGWLATVSGTGAVSLCVS